MIRTFTINGAYQLKRENKIGKIAVGKKADLVVIDDILKMNPQDIKNAQLQLCLNGGEIVYRKEREEHDCEI